MSHISVYWVIIQSSDIVLQIINSTVVTISQGIVWWHRLGEVENVCTIQFQSFCHLPTKIYYKKDGYRQQNVRQRQKLNSIIDYDVCMTFY